MLLFITSYLRWPFFLMHSGTSPRIILWWELSCLKFNYLPKTLWQMKSSFKLLVKLVWDKAGQVTEKASGSQVDVLTPQRPPARSDVLEAQTDRAEWFWGCFRWTGIDHCFSGQEEPPSSQGWRSLLFRDLTFNQTHCWKILRFAFR